MELNVPMTMPKVSTHANGRITSPPKISSASEQASVVDARHHRARQRLVDRLVEQVVQRDLLATFLRFSRTRSKITTLSFIE